MPIINQPSLFPGPNSISGSAWGLGDINPSLFFSPAKPGAVIWGVGPTLTIPTATDSKLGSSKFSLGPTAVALTIQGPWVLGALINNQRSVAGWGDTDANQMLLQPFVNFNLPHGWYRTSSPIMTANWGPPAAVSGPCPWAGAWASCYGLAAPLPGPVPAPDLPVAYARMDALFVPGDAMFKD